MIIDNAIICVGCGRHPSEIQEYDFIMREFREEGDYPNWEAVMDLSDGTYNPKTKHFYCTDCYVKAGMPTGVAE